MLGTLLVAAVTGTLVPLVSSLAQGRPRARILGIRDHRDRRGRVLALFSGLGAAFLGASPGFELGHASPAGSQSRSFYEAHIEWARPISSSSSYTLEYGKVRGMARAARRPKSRFGGSLEVGTEVELTFFEKESRELVSVDRCDIVRSKFSELGEPVLASTLGYLTDLVDGFALEREPNPRIYRLLRAIVDSMNEDSNPEVEARYFEAWLLRLSGFYPRRRTCPGCGRALAEVGARYHPAEQRLACGRCLDTGIQLSGDALSYLQRIWATPPAKLEEPQAPRVLRELGVFHYHLIQEQLEKDLKSHRVLEDLLKEERRAANR